MNTKITTTLLTIITISSACASTQPGWGSNTTKRTIGGMLGGATIGGIIGHQHDKQKEGILIGTVLGGLVGNRSGTNKDYREDRDRREWEQKSARWRYEERQRKLRSTRASHVITNNRPASIGTTGNLHNDPEIIAARQQAEQLELELQRRQQARERELRKQQLLLEYKQRATRADEQLSRSQY